jgi:hypothetical protein
MRKRAWLVAAVVLSLGIGVATGWVIHGPQARPVPNSVGKSSLVAPPSTTANATISGTFVVLGGRTTSPRPLSGCVSVTRASSVGLPAPCDVPVGSDGTWSVTLRPGPYAVFGFSPMFNGGKKACAPANNPVRVRVGGHVVVEIVCSVD